MKYLGIIRDQLVDDLSVAYVQYEISVLTRYLGIVDEMIITELEDNVNENSKKIAEILKVVYKEVRNEDSKS